MTLHTAPLTRPKCLTKCPTEMSDPNIRPNVRPNIRPNVRLKCPTQMFDQMFDQMSDQIFDPMSDQMSDQMFDQTFNQIFDQMFVRNFRPKLLPTHVLQNIGKMQQKCCLRRRPNILRMEQRVIFNMFGGVKNSISADYLVRPKSWRRVRQPWGQVAGEANWEQRGSFWGRRGEGPSGSAWGRHAVSRGFQMEPCGGKEGAPKNHSICICVQISLYTYRW